MTEQHEPAVYRIPMEICWEILGEAIDQHNPLFYFTTFEGSAWSEYSSRNFFALEGYLQKNAEAQRKIIGSVCRTWQAFARARRDLCVTIKHDGTSDVLRNLEGASNARHGELHSGVCQKIITSQHCAKGFNWEIVEMRGERVEVFILIPFPRLQRLRMNPWGKFDPTKLLNALDKFSNIVWLDYEAGSSYGYTPALDKNKSPVTLPNLQVLWCNFKGHFEFPFQHLLLPSLRYLSFHIDAWPYHISLIDVLSHYCRKLRSCTFNMRVLTAERLNPLSIQFLPWDEFPELEELFIEGPWMIKFDLLPPKHPLQSLTAQHDSFSAVPSLFKGGNMKEVFLQGVTLADDGNLKGRKEEVIMDKAGVDHLLEQAEGRGILLNNSRKGNFDGIVFHLDPVTEDAPGTCSG